MSELSPILAELEKAYSTLQAEWAKELGVYVHSATAASPIINLASKGRKRTQLSWYTPAVWVDGQEEMLSALSGDTGKVAQRAEITLATELLDDPDKTIAELGRMLLVHYFSSGGGGWDFMVPKNGYYSTSWDGSTLVQVLGFRATVLPDQPARGYAGWEPISPDLWSKWVKEHVNLAVFDVYRKGVGLKEKAGSRMKKWTCGCTTIRCATRVEAICQFCGKHFAWAEPYEPPHRNYRDAMVGREVRDIINAPLGAANVNGSN